MTIYVLDDTVLRGFGECSDDAANLIASLDARSIRMAIPQNALITAEAGLSDEQCEYINAVVERLDHILLDDLTELDHLSSTAHVAAWIGQPEDAAAAHALALARRLDCPILTMNAKRWEHPRLAIPWQVRIVEFRQDG
ncbi:hypothetical protein OHB26_19950 [Nocardia sp. NBC_01503]|uniref:hypothetical protein n=1 Tax=Nocardia sp. NBC_01503 TaxID=2975997 RepID=UPI002E7C307A|nr:hypothetical protein [Nocardia sp. NBC_01503]WTL29289.1 hypothetical protein OHB26_19950 [Nocardia sp. NBC_01503]